MKKVTLLLVLLILFSCKRDEKQAEVEKIVKEWIGKEIKFSNDYKCSVLGKDTILSVDSLNNAYKILLYVDSTDCIDCKLRIVEWKQLITESDSLFSDQLSFLFFFYPKNEKRLQFLFEKYNFDYPVFIDNTNQIYSLNKFPSNPLYQCFLLDKDNKVIMVGNPTLNPNIWKLYKEEILGKPNSEDEELTIVKMDKETYDFGNVKKDSKNYMEFTLKNTGIKPLVIQRIITSCGCTAVEWEKHPIAPGKENFGRNLRIGNCSYSYVKCKF